MCKNGKSVCKASKGVNAEIDEVVSLASIAGGEKWIGRQVRLHERGLGREKESIQEAESVDYMDDMNTKGTVRINAFYAMQN